MNISVTVGDSPTLSLPEKKRDRSYLIWSFLIPLSMMLLIYALDGVFPFGDNSVLVLDLNGQYIGFYEALRAWVYGDGSLLYSFARSLGGEMMGIYAYYLASPLSYIVALFPEAYMTEALLFIFILKAGLCGLTFGYYLHRCGHTTPWETVMFSTLYALCSFAVVMQHNSMWIDNLILLPLVTLGVESVVKYRRYPLFVASLALALLSNFYIGFMTCIYVLLYFFYYFYAFSDGRNNPLHEKQHYLRSLIRMGFYSLLSIGIAAIILLTVSYSLSFGKTEFTDPSYVPYLQFNPLQFFAKLLPGVYDTVEPEGLPFAYCGVVTLLLVPLYFLNRRFHRTERIASLVFLLVFYVSMSISTLDMLWHGGQAPNWLNYRYIFFLCFFLLVLASRAYARIKDLSTRTILSVAVVLLVLIALTAAMGFPFFSTTTAILSALLVAVFAALLIGIRKNSGSMRRYLAMLLVCLSLAEVFYNGNTMLAALHEDVGATTRKEYQGYHESTGETINWLKEYDKGFYRTEVLYHRVTNDTMELGYRGLTNSTSTLNAKTIMFLHRMGLLSTSHWSEYYGSTMTLDSLLGIRYVLTDSLLTINEVYELCHENSSKAVHRNPYALPIAFAANQAVAKYDMSAPIAPLQRQNEMIAALLGEAVKDCYTPVEAEVSYEKILAETMEYKGVEYHALYSDVYLENEDALARGEVDYSSLKAPESSFSFHATIPHDGTLYFYIPTDYPSALEIFIDDAFYGTIYEENDDFVKGLGKYTAGEEITVTLRMSECCDFFYPTDAVVLYVEDTAAVVENLSALGTGGMQLSSFTEDYFLGKIVTTQEKPTVQTTIPYDAGWIVTVDGVRTETYETLDALLAFDTAPGSHTVEMIYRPTCYIVGRAISIASLLLLICLLVIELLWRRGILHPAQGSLPYRMLDIFFYADAVPAEPNDLSDEEMDRAEAARLPVLPPEEETDATAESEDEQHDG